MRDSSDHLPPTECLKRMMLKPLKYLGGRLNQHWLVDVKGTRHVLRGYDPSSQDISYEHHVMNRLHRAGWPVPVVVDEPVSVDDRIWCLFTYLPGVPIKDESSTDRIKRGRLLAELHQVTSTFTDLPQRSGFQQADVVVRDPELLDRIRQYESIDPNVGHLLRWYLEKTIALYESISIQPTDLIVLHSDFTAWNLLFDNGQLTGVLDFESTHLNLRVSDFALSWRGCYMEVIEGYEEIHPLTERERAQIVPAYWSWLFIGVADLINRILHGDNQSQSFEWIVKQLQRRSILHTIEPYTGK